MKENTSNKDLQGIYKTLDIVHVIRPTYACEILMAGHFNNVTL